MNEYSDVYDKFKRWLENHPLGLAKKTTNQYLFIVKKLLSYLEVFNLRTFNEVSHEIFVRFAHIKPNKEVYAKSSIIQRIAALDIFFSWAVSHGWLREENNPVIYYKKIKIQPRRFDNDLSKNNIFSDILTPEEQKKLMDANTNEELYSTRKYCIVLLILGTGLFVEEISALRKDNVNLKNGYLLIKGSDKKERKVKIDLNICGKACKAWEKYRQDILGEENSPYYFINRNKAKIEPNRLYEIVSTILKNNGIQKKQMGPDLLRQTAIYNFSKAGYSLEELKNITGIKTSRLLEKYKAVAS